MRALPAGIYTPLPTFFDDQEEIDLDSLKKHVEFVAKAGTVPVLTGSMGEACHLDAEEREIIVKATREVLDKHDATRNMPLVVGVGAPSTRETIKHARAAAASGADFVMVIPPGYYAGNLKQDGMLGIKKYVVDVSNGSPIPVIVYNFPALSGGIDITSELVVEMMKEGANICGMKFTCADVAKISRITAALEEEGFRRQYPRRFHKEVGSSAAVPYFSAIDGFIDILLPSVSVGAVGAISGLPNLAPRACMKLWKLCEASRGCPEKHREARKLQDLVNEADNVVKAVGVPGMKFLLANHFGYGKSPRRPLLPYDVPSPARGESLVAFEGLARVMKLEKELSTR
jgi:4-hydroxy-2-oxoglutarate aldolase